MKKEFVTYTQSLALKELGFDEPCMFVHDTWGNTKNWTEDGEGEHRNSDKNASIYYSAPLKQQVFRWFREKHGLSGIPDDESYSIWKLILGVRECMKEVYPLNNFEEAESACIDELIEIIKNK